MNTFLIFQFLIVVHIDKYIMKILFLTTIIPLKQNSGGEIVSNLFIENLIYLGHSVDVLGYLRKDDNKILIPSNMHLVKKIVVESNSSMIFSLMNICKSILMKRCYSSQKYITKEYIKQLKKEFIRKTYDYVVIDHFQMGWILEYLPRYINVASIAHNIESDLYDKLSKDKSQNILLRRLYCREAYRMRILEKKVINISKLVWTLTSDNKNRYGELFPKAKDKLRVACVPYSNNVKVENYSNETKEWDIGIIGTWTWESNSAGLKWFFDKIYPLLPESVTIRVAGSGAEWLLGKYPNVLYIGFVEDANLFIYKSRVIAIPSIEGDGIQIKSLQAIALGANIVATPFALRGIYPVPDYVYQTDNPIDFKDNLVRLKQSITPNFSSEASAWTELRKEQFLKSLDI